MIATKIFSKHPHLKTQLWEGDLWTQGYEVSTVSIDDANIVLSKHMLDQGKTKEYIRLYRL